MARRRASPAAAAPLLCVDASALADAAVVPPSWLSGATRLPHLPRGLAEAVADGHGAAIAGLVVRSMTRVAAAELAMLPALRAVATLSSGVDHLDLDALADRGIDVYHGRGGNAPAVAGWVMWALSRLWHFDGRSAVAARPLTGRRIVVVGAGAVGAEVARHLEAAGALVQAIDPPRAARDAGFVGATWADALRSPPDAITVHVPLVDAGLWPTRGLIGRAHLDAARGALLLQAARGGVVDEPAAAAARRSGQLAGLALDVYRGEPAPDPGLLAVADLATPHIAGHTVEGKLRVAALALTGLRQRLGLAGCALDAAATASALEAAVQTAALAVCAADPLGPDGGAALDAANAALRAGGDFRALRAHHRRLDPPPAIR